MACFMLAAILMCLISTSSAYDFYVGGRDGWVENPKESYNNWAARMRFQVNDKLVFKYKKTGDTVLVVKKEDYGSCNVNNPIQKLDGGGDSASFRFNRSGPFFFISGAQDGCSKGQKMIVVVMAVRGKNPLPPPPAAAPTPSLQPPTSLPSPSPSSMMAPTPSPSASPIAAPTPSPSTIVSPPVPAPSSVVGGGGGPAGNEPEASPTSAPPAKSSSSSLTASRVTIATVALVLSHALG